jgi:uncharacterized Zn finger protein
MSATPLIAPGLFERLATPSNLRLGRQIVAESGVERLSTASGHIKARVGGVPSAEQTRTVEIFVGEDGLKWSCTCTRRRDLFCKHCVAAAVVAANPSA